ncbi:hypothetical protein [Vulcanisaeta souniana]|uniref:Uncharacterized protein n=1 Tax=Vulcanisaeta souniana JCM 11219 TaxID=1293586 RepID=A0A830E4Y9_9CREN|nr:hypothetical protein [Vulcanisaeta souniana]BDR93040.1 hypothetical protein Vsou_21330 [Vulcanisaeta souniana JCM 11219]GGI83350.1 hypothetical protein GCM10007112_20220 [Vulcanisaeta souniana JCM 11219]
MIYKSLLPILITLLIMIAITTYLMYYINIETTKAITLENKYLLSIDTFKQLNETLPQILQNRACVLITNPINYTCNLMAVDITNSVNNALGAISNDTNNLVIYRVVNYTVYGDGGLTIYRIVIDAFIQSSNIEGTIIVSYPFNLCYYSQLVRDVSNGFDSSITINANNITDAIWKINNELADKVAYHGQVRIILHYSGVFSMIKRTRNYTVYSGLINYVLSISPDISICNETSEITGGFHAMVIIDAFVNNTYYFSVNGAVGNN